MLILEQLGVALGLATLSGLNLYLTVFIAGLAIRFDWVQLADRFQSLDVLGHPVVIGVAGVLFAMQFIADKVPWVDSLWDSVHTFIRPVGATIIALKALGPEPAYVEVVAALLAGGAALTTHGAKAGTRLLINHSPEPVSNIVMSLGEDVAVTGGMALLIFKPVIAFFVFSAVLILIWMIFPRLWRIIRTTLWLAWHKLRMPGKKERLEKPVELQREVNHELRDLLTIKAEITENDVRWTARCLSGRCKGVRGLSPNLRGLIVGVEKGAVLHFAASKTLRDRLFKIPLAEAAITVESRFLSENLVVEATGLRAVFRFPRGEGDIAETVALRVREMIGQARAAATTMGEHAIEPVTQDLMIETHHPAFDDTAHVSQMLPLPALE